MITGAKESKYIFVMKNILLPVLLSILTAISCRENPQYDSTAVEKEFQRIEDIYRTNNIDAVYNQLLSFQKWLETRERDSMKGIDYDTSLAVTYGRLFLVCAQFGDSNKVEIYFTKSAGRFNARRKKKGIAPLNFDFELLSNKIEKWDSISQVPVQWKMNRVPIHGSH